MIGRRLSHYVLLDRLAKGGMGEVYRARDTVLEREVALKILPDELAEDPVLLERFELEAKAVAGLNHPNIVTLHSVEQVGGVKFLTMELIEGETLAERIPEGGMELEEFFDIAIQVTRGMEAAHAGGIVHRDLKPLNVMIGAEGRVKILDFGLAIEEEAAAAAAKTPASGRILGSIPYMSPEHLRAEPVRATSDVFALGVMFFEMLAG